MSKDKSYGALIFIISILVIAYYTYLAIVIRLLPDITFILPWIPVPPDASYWVIALPVWVGMLGIFGIAAWVGFTMLTTPPPVPLEEPADESAHEESMPTASE
ncbi:MAG: hypothetical protein ACTSW4_01965 [Candidatus Ranarchaeia archaeon]